MVKEINSLFKAQGKFIGLYWFFLTYNILCLRNRRLCKSLSLTCVRYLAGAEKIKFNIC